MNVKELAGIIEKGVEATKKEYEFGIKRIKNVMLKAIIQTKKEERERCIKIVNNVLKEGINEKIYRNCIIYKLKQEKAK